MAQYSRLPTPMWSCVDGVRMYVRCLITTNGSYMLFSCENPYRALLGDILLPSLNSSGTHSPLRPSSKTSCAACLRPMRSRPQPTPWARHERCRLAGTELCFNAESASCKSSQHQIWALGGCPLAMFRPWRGRASNQRTKRPGVKDIAVPMIACSQSDLKTPPTLLYISCKSHLPPGWYMPIASSLALTSGSSGYSRPAVAKRGSTAVAIPPLTTRRLASSGSPA
jgi:hypothetical protein